mmetsp:Transcript_10325/g.40338  ORF Transcript_10325/g.40338 Transcript_10325/m.40338 type:complete len:253 (+) Transcript_10325:727-1485(+)
MSAPPFFAAPFSAVPPFALFDDPSFPSISSTMASISSPAESPVFLFPFLPPAAALPSDVPDDDGGSFFFFLPKSRRSGVNATPSSPRSSRSLSPSGVRPANPSEHAVAPAHLPRYAMHSFLSPHLSYVCAVSSYTSPTEGDEFLGRSGCASSLMAHLAMGPPRSRADRLRPSFGSFAMPMAFSRRHPMVLVSRATSPSVPSLCASRMAVSQRRMVASYFSRLSRLRKKMHWCRSLSPRSTTPRSSMALAAAL